MSEAERDTVNVFIIDDDPLIPVLVRAMASGTNMVIDSTTDPLQGEELVFQRDPDVVLLDVRMPKMDGFELCRRLKENPATQLIPVVLVTALDSKDDRLRGLEQGADDFMSKPTDRIELIARVKSLARVRRLTRSLNTTIDSLNHEITQRMRVEEALRQSIAELDHFARGVAHDLKAPLRGIAMLSDWLEQELGATLSDEGKKYLGMLHRNAGRLSLLVDELLRYAKLGSDRAPVEEVNTAELLNDTIALLAVPSDYKVVVRAPMPTLRTHRAQLQQTFANLVINAIKYRGAQGARVEISAEQADGHTIFSVADDGPGIAPEYHGKIFEVFMRLQSAEEVEGTGLGLALAKKLVESHGGAISVGANATGGARFTFSWLAAAPEAAAPSQG